MVLIQPQPTVDDISRIQHQENAYEHSVRLQRGTTRDAHGPRRSHEEDMIAHTALLIVLISDAHGSDHWARGENKTARVLVSVLTGNGR